MSLISPLVVSLVVLSAAPDAPEEEEAVLPCDPAFASKFKSVEPVFTATARFRQAAGEGKTSFTELVKQGDALRKLATQNLEEIQNVGCDLSLEETKRFDACVAPVKWGCEGTPPIIDWTLLKDVPRDEDGKTVYALNEAGLDLLSENLSFAGGCGDFGCAPRSIALPSLLADTGKVDQLVTLAARPGFFGPRAARSLEVMGTTLAKATCEGGGWRPESPEALKGLVAHLDARGSALTEKSTQATRARKAVQKLSAALKRGLPKKTCKMPGGE